MSTQSDYVKKWLLSESISQTDLAQELGTHPCTISQMVNGSRAFSKKVCKALSNKYGFREAFLIYGEEPPFMQQQIIHSNVNSPHSSITSTPAETIQELRKMTDEALASKQETLSVMQDLLKTQQALIEAKQEAADLRQQIIELIKGQDR